MKTGDRLNEIIESRLLIRLLARSRKKNCNCRTWIEQMNAWGPKGCRKYQAMIVDHLVEEAKDALIVRMPELAIRMEAQGCLDEAIQDTDLPKLTAPG